MAKTDKPEASAIPDVLRMAQEVEDKLKQEPLEVHIGVVNVLVQLCQYRQAMVLREEEKKAKQQKLAEQFSPHQKV